MIPDVEDHLFSRCGGQDPEKVFWAVSVFSFHQISSCQLKHHGQPRTANLSLQGYRRHFSYHGVSTPPPQLRYKGRGGGFGWNILK